jgi:hypothetical protein
MLPQNNNHEQPDHIDQDALNRSRTGSETQICDPWREPPRHASSIVSVAKHARLVNVMQICMQTLALAGGQGFSFEPSAILALFQAAMHFSKSWLFDRTQPGANGGSYTST